MHLLLLGVGCLATLTSLLLTATEAVGQCAEALQGMFGWTRHRFHVHTTMSAFVLFGITTTPLFAHREVDATCLEEFAFGCSCFVMLLHLRSSFTFLWVVLTLCTAWVSVGVQVLCAESAMRRVCVCVGGQLLRRVLFLCCVRVC